jgi:hypothetical protein
VPRHGPRIRLIVAATFLVAGTFALAANGASGMSPAGPTSIPDSAFQPVTLPAPATAATPLATPAATPVTPAATPDLRPFAHPWPSASTEPAERAQPDVPDSEPIVVVRPTPTPPPAGGGQSISGLASWYCRADYSICTNNHPDTSGFDAFAAAGPALRQAIGSDWRGSIVYVDGIRVKLIDWCQCYKGEPHEKLLDLYYDVFARTGSRVTVRW